MPLFTRYTLLAAPSLLAVCVGAAVPAHAQSTRAGLWEHQTTIKTASGHMEKQMEEAKKQMSAMPPEQRVMIEQMMAQQGLAMGKNGMTTVRFCITPEQAAAADIPSHDENCQYKVTQRSATGMKMTFACKDEHKTHGEGEITFNGQTAYSGKYVLSTVVNGKPERMNMTQSGKWLSADCGKLQPIKR